MPGDLALVALPVINSPTFPRTGHGQNRLNQSRGIVYVHHTLCSPAVESDARICIPLGRCRGKGKCPSIILIPEEASGMYSLFKIKREAPSSRICIFFVKFLRLVI